MAVVVSIEVSDSQAPAQVVAGVQVNIYDANDVFVTSAITDALGVASFLLAGAVAPGTTYRVRYFQVGTTFTQPGTIAVIEPEPAGNPNEFTTIAQTYVLDPAPDPNYCRVQGFVTDATGAVLVDQMVLVLRPAAQLSDTYSWPGDPTGASGRMVAHRDVEIRTDDTGYVSFDLVRGGNYVGFVVGMHDRRANIEVPNVASVDILDLLFPLPLSVSYAPDPAAVPDGDTLAVTPTVLLSSGLTLESLAGLTFTSSNEAVVTVARGTTDIVLTGVAPGAATVTASYTAGDFPSRVPTQALTGAALAVTVA